MLHVRRRDVGREALSIRVGGAHDLADATPVARGERLPHVERRVSDTLEQFEDQGVAFDVRLEHLPVVRARQTRLARVADDHTPLQLFGVNLNRLATYACGVVADRVRAAVERAVVILKACGHAYDRRLDVGGDDDVLALRVAVADQSVQSADARDGERARPSEACARGRGALRDQMKACLRLEEVHELRDEFQSLLAREAFDL